MSVMSSRGVAPLVLLLASAGSCRAALSSLWVEVDNSRFTGSNALTGLDSGLLDGNRYRTFDLFITSDLPVLLFDSGKSQSSGPNGGLRLTPPIPDGSFFQRDNPGAGGGKLPPDAPAILNDPLLQFDTFVGVGLRPATGILVASAISFDANTVLGTWSTAAGSGPEVPDANGRIFFGRFTVRSTLGFGNDESATRSLGGQVLVFQQGATSGRVLQIPNAYATIPAPAAALLGLVAAIGGARRRRMA